MENTRVVLDWFWNEKFWLPPNVTWRDLDRSDGTIYLPDASDLLLPLPIALFLCLVRFVWERCVSRQVGRYFNLKESSPRKPPDNKLLQAAFDKGHQQPGYETILELSKKLDWSPRQVERWWRRKRVSTQPSIMKKFNETSWRFLYYFVAFWSGVYLLKDKPWFWDTRQCWQDWPRQHIDNGIWMYFMISLSFYWALVISVMWDIKRKDFFEQMVHHVASIILLSMSWTINIVRLGSLTIMVHDAADSWLEAAKMTSYTQHKKLCDALFITFTIVWFISRLGIYPFWILNSALFESYDLLGLVEAQPLYIIFQVLLLVLQLLHIIWSIRILIMVYSYIICGHVKKDERSESEPSSTSDDETTKKRDKNKSTNGNSFSPLHSTAGKNGTTIRVNGSTTTT